MKEEEFNYKVTKIAESVRKVHGYDRGGDELIDLLLDLAYYGKDELVEE